MTTTLAFYPISGSLLSVTRLLDEIIADDLSLFSQGIPIVNGNKFLSYLPPGAVSSSPDVVQQIMDNWKRCWCKYYAVPKTRGRPPTRAIYFFKINLELGTGCNCDLTYEDIHRFLGLLFFRLEPTREAYTLIFVRSAGPALFDVSVLIHPVSLAGRILRLSKDFSEIVGEAIDKVLCSDVRQTVKEWL